MTIMYANPVEPLGRLITLVDCLQLRAQRSPGADAVCFLDGRELAQQPVSYAELDRRARAVACALRGRLECGDRVVLLFPPGLEFLTALFGCFYAGAIAVPAYPPHPARLPQTLPRFWGIVRDSGARLVLGPDSIVSRAPLLAGVLPEITSVPFAALEPMLEAGNPDAWAPPATQADSIAFLQYTSG